MRILIANNLYGANARGGAETIAAMEAAALVAAGHEVLVMASASRESSADGNPAVRFYLPSQLFWYGDLAKHGVVARTVWHLVDVFGRAATRQFMSFVDDWKPDVVHTHNLMGLGYTIPRALRRQGVRHVHTVHDVQLVNPSGLIPVGGSSALVRFGEALHAALLRRIFGSPEVVTFPSEFLRRFYEARGFFPKSRRMVIPNPAPAVAAGERTKPESPRFLFVGQLTEQKGVRLLLAAWREAAISGATLTIIGDGALADEVRAAAANDSSIIYRGRLANEEALASCGRASFLVVPSLILENTPTVILEALAAGTPVISFSQGGIPEMVRDGENGRLVPASKNATVLAMVMREAASIDDGAWSNMSRAAKVTAAGRTMDQAIDAWLEIFSGQAR